jgi:hypothetical protein
LARPIFQKLYFPAGKPVGLILLIVGKSSGRNQAEEQVS